MNRRGFLVSLGVTLVRPGILMPISVQLPEFKSGVLLPFVSGEPVPEGWELMSAGIVRSDVIMKWAELGFCDAPRSTTGIVGTSYDRIRARLFDLKLVGRLSPPEDHSRIARGIVKL